MKKSNFLFNNSIYLITIIWFLNLILLGTIINSNAGLKINSNSFTSEYVFWIKPFINPETLQKFCYTLQIVLTLIFFMYLYKYNNASKIITVKSNKFNLNGLIASTILSVVIILINIWDFSYKIKDAIWVNQFHNNFVLVAATDIQNGKTLLVDTFSQYGSGFVLSLKILMNLFGGIGYKNLYLTLMFVNLLYFIIFAILFYIFTNSLILTQLVVWISTSITFNFNLINFPNTEQYEWPGGTPVRYFFDLFIILFLFLHLKNTQNRLIIFFLGLFTGLALYWNLESGFSITISLFVAIIILHFIKLYKLNIKNIFTFFITLFSFLFLVNVITFIFSDNLIKIDNLFLIFELVSKGWLNIPSKLFDWYLIPYLFSIYFIGWIFTNIKSYKKDTQMILIISFAGLFYFLINLNYYWARSYNSNLWIILIPFIFSTAIIINIIFRSRDEINKFDNFIINTFFTIILLIMIISLNFSSKRFLNRFENLNRIDSLKKVYNLENITNYIDYVEETSISVEKLKDSIDLIKSKELSNRALIFSHYQGILIIGSEKSNFFPIPQFEEVYKLSQFEQMENYWNTAKKLPEYMFVDFDITPTIFEPKDSTWYSIFKSVSPCYVKSDRSGFLQSYKLADNNCKVSFNKEKLIPYKSTLN